MYIYSTLSNSQMISQFNVVEGGIPKRGKSVIINGGSNVANKNLVTPRGVVTELSDADYALVKDDKSFKRWVERGYITVDSKNIAVEKVVADMDGRDESAPLVPQDFEGARGAKLTEGSAKLASDAPVAKHKKAK